MKSFYLIIALLFQTMFIFGQSSFEVEQRSVKTGSIEKSYKFYFQIKDSIELDFGDSIIIYQNQAKTITKQISYTSYSRLPETRIEYHGKGGRDSLTKIYNGKKLKWIYSWKYDKKGRLLRYSMTDLQSPESSRQGFTMAYEYRDSLIATGKMVLGSVYNIGIDGKKQFEYLDITEFNSKNQKIKELRGKSANDPAAQKVTYEYNDNGSLIAEFYGGIPTTRNTNRENTLCEKQLTQAI